ncbi:MAG: aldo/keto reductase [Stellaceae bacterium]
MSTSIWCHWPDPNTPLDETMAALDNVVRQGKVRCFSSRMLFLVSWAEGPRVQNPTPAFLRLSRPPGK